MLTVFLPMSVDRETILHLNDGLHYLYTECEANVHLTEVALKHQQRVGLVQVSGMLSSCTKMILIQNHTSYALPVERLSLFFGIDTLMISPNVDNISIKLFSLISNGILLTKTQQEVSSRSFCSERLIYCGWSDVYEERG